MHLLNNPIYHIFKRDYKIKIQICLSSNKRHKLYTRCTDENREIEFIPKSSPTIPTSGTSTFYFPNTWTLKWRFFSHDKSHH